LIQPLLGVTNVSVRCGKDLWAIGTMSSNAIQAVKQFSKTGAGYDISVTKEIVIGITLGLGAGAVWKSWHINSKRKINEYYEALDHLTKEKGK